MTAGAYEHIPTRRERFWRWVGFRYHLGEDEPGAALLEGWMRTDTRMNFSWSDRLRLLVSGRLRFSTIVRMNTPSPDVTKTRMDWHIEAPGEGGR